jgi:hypothetical protein
MEDYPGISVYEPEIDMNRPLRRAPAGPMKRFLKSMRWLRTGSRNLGKPRRSIDREQQEYSPLCER